VNAGASSAVETVWRSERRRVLATLIRLLGSFDAAEEACQEAFLVASKVWPTAGIPANPYSWLVSTGRFRMIDRWRRRARLAAAIPEMVRLAETETDMADPNEIRDDELRLIFTCCHPALPPDAQIALTLREVGGLTSEEVARAYLTRPPTIAQRIVRAKARIRDEQIPYAVPDKDELPARLEAVLRVFYLIFNEGYAATGGPSLTRAYLCAEAIRLTRLVTELIDDPEAQGLLALMLLHEARRASRVDANGDIVLLEDQDRASWDPDLIAEARRLIDRTFARREVGSYLLQAAIASVHILAPRFEDTDWRRIVVLYDALVEADPSPVVDLNRAIALGMRDGADAGLARVDALVADERLVAYAPAHIARARFLGMVGRNAEAHAAYGRALAQTSHPAERRLYERMSRDLLP
jgi:RNA polymerase sigma-70 factor, ECF subfamily